MKRTGGHIRYLRQDSVPYRATEEIERFLEQGLDVVIRGGGYTAQIVAIISTVWRSYEVYTVSQPFVYGDSETTLQAALDELDREYRSAVARQTPKPLSKARSA